MIYDSWVGFLEIKALSLKNKLESDEIIATNRNTIKTTNHQFYFNKLLTSKGFKIQNDVLTKETVKVSAVCGI